MIEVYNPCIHDYEKDKPSFIEIEEGHFVMCNERERIIYEEVINNEI